MNGRNSERHPSSLEDGRVASDEDEVNKEFPLEYMERDAVGVTYGNGSREELEETGADYIIDNMNKLTRFV